MQELFFCELKRVFARLAFSIRLELKWNCFQVDILIVTHPTEKGMRYTGVNCGYFRDLLKKN